MRRATGLSSTAGRYGKLRTLNPLLEHDRRLLVLSPHLDDAILSAFSLFSARRSSTVVTVFDGHPASPVTTEWDRLCGFTDSTSAMAARHLEDEAAFADLPVRRDYLGLLDTSYLASPRTDEDSVIRKYVQEWVEVEDGPAIVAVPAGAGRTSADSGAPLAPPSPVKRVRRALVRATGPVGRSFAMARARRLSRRAISVIHEDHEYVRDVVLALLPELPDVTVALYEELPYAWGKPADDAVAHAGSVHGVVTRAEHLVVDRERKASAIRAYASQLLAVPSPHGPLDSASTLPEFERFWLIDPSTDGPAGERPPVHGAAT